MYIYIYILCMGLIRSWMQNKSVMRWIERHEWRRDNRSEVLLLGHRRRSAPPGVLGQPVEMGTNISLRRWLHLVMTFSVPRSRPIYFYCFRQRALTVTYLRKALKCEFGLLLCLVKETKKSVTCLFHNIIMSLFNMNSTLLFLWP